ncbi:hypothetical protein R80B4_02077 [Fibrobacteres bacterium R8-0-B4]
MAVKTAKKALKKAKPATRALPTAKKSAKKAVRKHTRPRMTLEEYIASTEATRRWLTATMAAEHAKTEAALRELKAVSAKTEAEVEAMCKRVDKNSEDIREQSLNLGKVNNRIGGLVELIVIPKLRLDVNKAGGYSFTDSKPNKRVRAVVNGKKEYVAEADMFLFNDSEAMAVEVKAHLKQTDVADHINRLRMMRDYEEEADIKGKKLFGAVVGAAVDADARKFAKKNGMYVIDIIEEEDRLAIDAPETCKVW